MMQLGTVPNCTFFKIEIMQCKVRQQQEIDPARWNAFVYENSMGWAYFLYEVIGIDRNASYRNLSFAIVDEDNHDEILFIMQLHRTGKYGFLSRLGLPFWREKLVSRWGFVIKDGLVRKHQHKVKECFGQYIDSYIHHHPVKRFSAELAPLTVDRLNNRNGINPLVFYNFKPEIKYTWVVDLSKPDDRMLADCEETTRQAVRKIEASGRYEFIEAQPTQQDCLTYISLHKETYTRTGAKKDIIADAYHHNIFFNLIPKGISRVFFLKDKETGEIVATVALLIFRDTAYYWWGDSRNEKEVGVNKYLLFKAIYLIRESFGKTGYFETGGAYPYLRRGKYKGLSDFKKCFGTFLLPIFAGVYEKNR